MSKKEELDCILRAINYLGQDSYCGPWLAKQVPYLQDCMAKNYLPETTDEVLIRLNAALVKIDNLSRSN